MPKGRSSSQALSLVVGTVLHRRLRPFRHRFDYRVFSLLLDIDQVQEAAKTLRLFSVGRWNLLGFDPADHGPRDGSDLRLWAEAHLRAAGLEPDGGRIRLLCFPRLLGRVFDPLSVWLCEDKAGGLRAILWEVRNRNRQAHTYVLPVSPEQAASGLIRQSAAKDFYVSPFIAMDMAYRFRLALKEDRLSLFIGVDERQSGQPVLTACQWGDIRPVSDGALARLLLSHPLMSWKVVAGIYWEALKIRRRVPFLRPPAGVPPVAASYPAGGSSSSPPRPQESAP